MPPDENLTADAHAGTLAFAPGALAAPLSRYAAGAVLSGKYRLQALIGEGGMGAVWKASNELLDLPVAIKLIRADLDRGSLRARLQIEARAAAKLGHPAIVRVFDVGETGFGDPFIVMELLQGETLGSMIGRGRLSGARAVQLLLPVVEALAMAHARGIVHRDLKPDNVMIAVENERIQPKILDFGIAKLTDPRDTDHKLTEVGVVVGSPEYMSPEQARGRDDVDSGSDIWAMCVVLYEAVTGVTPFSAPNYNALLRAIVEDAPKSLTEHAAGDAALWEIVQRGLAKDRNQRHPSMSALGRALAGWLLSHGVTEDACGASLETKWFGRNSAPELVPESNAGLRPVSADFQPQVTQESRSATGARGAFTANIGPRSNGRVRAVGGVLAACLLLGFGAYGIRHVGGATAPLKRETSAPVHALPASAPLPEASAAPEPAPVVAPAPKEAKALETAAPAVPIATKSPTASARTARAISAPRTTLANAKPAPTTAQPAQPAQPARPSKAVERPLDLLAPY
ncbi:MAG: protein kinase [Polyangiaceae bacterium]